ncbi:MAG: cysteine desulfurase [Micavibrio aeruginosavorus]|uniref:cysteine desulfurase n=1 Tax=Micavibrio aeruginosavorus TaxID=349221 RepID=A0A7T5R3I8_9BACT|nr:MAG: cysteine desulfurase [Micavibrio aeruginosavorus]
MEKNPVYLDYNASAPIRPDVADLMRTLMAKPGNASSIHSFGREARHHVEGAREQIAKLADTHANYVTFTSGATEANNAVLKHFSGRRVLVSAIEHPSVLESAPQAEKIPVTRDGVIDIEKLEELLSGEVPALVSVMLVNNETGVIQPVEEVARLARQRCPGVHIHTDAAQAAGKIPFAFAALGVDYLSLSAHKMSGPQGVGALLCAPGAEPVPFLHGGGQEKRQRAGTENVAGIAGFGLAADIALNHLDSFAQLSRWRDDLEKTLREAAPEITIFGQDAARVANTSKIGLPGIPANTQLMNLDIEGIAVSSGSACSSGTIKPSHVLQAMGAPEHLCSHALRISAGWATKESDFKRLAEVWLKMYSRVANKIVRL